MTPEVYKDSWTTPRMANQIPSPCMQISGKSTSGGQTVAFQWNSQPESEDIVKIMIDFHTIESSAPRRPS